MTTSITAATIFAKNCIKEAARAASRGDHSMAAELRASAARAVVDANSAISHLRAVTPAQEARAGHRKSCQRRVRADALIVADLEVISATIPAGQTVSAPVGIGVKVIVGFSLPSNWTAANLTFQVTGDGTSYQSYVDGTSATAVAVQVPPTATTPQLQPNTFVYVAPGTFDGVNMLKLVSSVAQANAVTVGLVARSVSF